MGGPARRHEVREANRRLVRRLVLLPLAMFGFGFALVPLYDVFCEITGLNGKVDTGRPAQAPQGVRVDASRTVRLELLAQVPESGRVEIAPASPFLEVHPGELRVAKFRARNLGAEAVVVRAVPSVTPGLAAEHLRKVQCFCFDEQRLAPGEVRDLVVVFYLDPALPEDIRTVSLGYTVFEVRRQARAGAAGAGHG